MKITKFVLFGLSVMAFASCSQDVELDEFQGQTAELISGNLKVRVAGDANANTRRKMHKGGINGTWQYYGFDADDVLGVYCPDAVPRQQQGLYKVVETMDWSEGTTKTLEKVSERGISYNTHKAKDYHRVFAAYPGGQINITGADPIEDVYTTMSLGCSFSSTVPDQVTASISSEKDADGYYTVADWSKAYFAGGTPMIPELMLSSTPGYADSYIIMYPQFTALELDMDIPENGMNISSIKLKGQVWVSENEPAVDVNIVGDCSGHIDSGIGEFNVDNFTVEGQPKDNQIITMTVDGEKELNIGDKLRSTFFFFPCGKSDRFFPKGSEIPFKIQVIVEYKVGEETKYAKATLTNQTITLGAFNNINLGTISNGTASTKKLTFS